MYAKVKSVEVDKELTSKNGKSYTATVLTVIKDEDGQERSFNIFANDAIHDNVVALGAGQSVNLKMEKDGKFWKPSGVTVMSNKTTSGSPKQQSVGGGGGYNDPERQHFIITQSMAKMAAEIVGTAANLGSIKKTSQPELLAGMTVDLTMYFLRELFPATYEFMFPKDATPQTSNALPPVDEDDIPF